MTTNPRCLALVKFVPPLTIRGKKLTRYPFKKGEAYVFMGEIPNMPGHCVVVAQKSGKIHAGYHTELFVELSSEET